MASFSVGPAIRGPGSLGNCPCWLICSWRRRSNAHRLDFAAGTRAALPPVISVLLSHGSAFALRCERRCREIVAMSEGHAFVRPSPLSAAALGAPSEISARTGFAHAGLHTLNPCRRHLPCVERIDRRAELRPEDPVHRYTTSGDARRDGARLRGRVPRRRSVRGEVQSRSWRCCARFGPAAFGISFAPRPPRSRWCSPHVPAGCANSFHASGQGRRRDPRGMDAAWRA